VPKYKILGRLDADRLPGAVPPDYRERVRMAARPGILYTTVLFVHERGGGVVTSAEVGQALRRIAAGETMLAIGVDFTREATEMLEMRGATVVRIGEFGWTDESYRSLPR
jgi:hypothetical protein